MYLKHQTNKNRSNNLSLKRSKNTLLHTNWDTIKLQRKTQKVRRKKVIE